VSHDSFWEEVDQMQLSEKMSQAESYPSAHCFLIDGYNFTDAQFS
jgi:hypothetical protein